MEEVRETSSITFVNPRDQVQSPNAPGNASATKVHKTSRGRQKIEIKEIKIESKRQVTFSKRRRGLFKKAAELSVLTGAQIAAITFSKSDRIYKFGHVDTLFDKYLRKNPVGLDVYSSDDDVEEEEESRMSWWERPVESVPEAELEEYMAAMSLLRENLGKRIIDMSKDRPVEVVPAWPINMAGFNPTVDMQSLERVAEGITRLRVGQNG